LFVLTSGFVLVEGDLSQAEVRLDGILAYDWDFLVAVELAFKRPWFLGFQGWTTIPIFSTRKAKQ